MYVHVSVYIYALDIIYILNISHITMMCSPKSVQYRIFLPDFIDALKPLLVTGGRCLYHSFQMSFTDYSGLNLLQLWPDREMIYLII